MRTSLAAGLVRSARRNFNHGTSEVRLFELGKVYHAGDNGRPLERVSLGILGTGGFAGLNWRNPGQPYDLFHMKGIVAGLLTRMRSAPFEFVPVQGIAWLDPDEAASVQVGGAQVGILGALARSVSEDLKLKQAVYVAELDFEALVPFVFAPVRYEPLPKYPGAERDLSVVISRDVPYAAIRSGIETLGIPELVSVNLIDVYEGEKIPPDKVSMTLRFSFLDREKTLTVDRVQAFSDNLLTFLRQTHGAVLR
jgi:phenylalanyl-tRNA synthetase beta chain